MASSYGNLMNLVVLLSWPKLNCFVT